MGVVELEDFFFADVGEGGGLVVGGTGGADDNFVLEDGVALEWDGEDGVMAQLDGYSYGGVAHVAYLELVGCGFEVFDGEVAVGVGEGSDVVSFDVDGSGGEFLVGAQVEDGSGNGGLRPN